MNSSTMNTLNIPNLVPWEDGFHPSGSNQAPGQIVNVQEKSRKDLFNVFDDAIDIELADQVYDSGIKSRVWGVYVTMDDIILYEKQKININKNILETKKNSSNQEELEQYHKYLALQLITQFLRQRVGDVITEMDWKRTHGIVVWVITSDVNEVVEYHIDYAEMFRYQNNIIYPPIYGSTLHVTRCNNDMDMKGGDFYVNTRGLDHYREFGYKNKFQGGSIKTLDHSSSSWIKVGYKFNRGILCDGNFPHYSSKVLSLPINKKRVIVGFNLFDHIVGPHAEMYPEHSYKFNRYVKLSQAVGATSSKQKITLQEVSKNPKLANFLKFLIHKTKEKGIDIKTLMKIDDNHQNNKEKKNEKEIE